MTTFERQVDIAASPEVVFDLIADGGPDRRQAGGRQGPAFEGTVLEAASLEGGGEGTDQQDARHQGEQPAVADTEQSLSLIAAGPHRARS